jgi:negative regulator of flagellin synthesis FlgM
MTIDRVGTLAPIQAGKPPAVSNRVNSGLEGDSVNISHEAAERAEFSRLFEMVSAAPEPEVRAGRVAELTAKINDPSYINDRILAAAADDIMTLLGVYARQALQIQDTRRCIEQRLHNIRLYTSLSLP